ncbi:MAG TPA: hypothetical protein VGI42_07530 [Chthoniobacterales bacterium]
MHKFFWSVLMLFTFALAPQTRACDLCGCYTPQLEALPQTDPDAVLGQPAVIGGPANRSGMTNFYGAIAEQFTHFETVQVNGVEVSNPTGQHLDSSITQLIAGYSFNSRLALQLNVPLIYRSFQRPNGFETDHGTESGLGDITLLTKLVAFHKEIGGMREPDFTVSALFLAGLKFPTGDSRRLKEEFGEIEVPGAPASGIHGHDLTLGTGSYDGIFGGQTSLRYKNFFFQSDLQFALRGDGLHQYHFANDLSWSGGPGFYFVRRHQLILGLQFVASGEHKDVDRFRGQAADDTGITSIFLGPHVVAAFGKISAEIAADLPVSIDNTAFQVVPDYRLRGGISLRF